MSDWNEGEFWEGFVPPESWYNPNVVDLKFDHQPTQAEIKAAAGGKEVGSIQYPQGELAWPGWNQERVDRVNSWETIKVFLVLGFILLCLLSAGLGLPLLAWMAG